MFGVIWVKIIFQLIWFLFQISCNRYVGVMFSVLSISGFIFSEEREVSNVRITAKVAGYSLVSYTPSLQEYGSALVYNIGNLLSPPYRSGLFL